MGFWGKFGLYFRPASITVTTRPISPSKAVLLALICSSKLLVTTLEASRDWRWRSSDLSRYCNNSLSSLSRFLFPVYKKYYQIYIVYSEHLNTHFSRGLNILLNADHKVIYCFLQVSVAGVGLIRL